jgi:hypothetical protein
VFVLTVRQPLAWAIIHAGKDIENRTWKPRRPCRVLIHAGRADSFDDFGLVALRLLRKRHVVTVPIPAAWEYKQIIGIVDVTEWDRERSRNDWAAGGHWHWHLANPVAATVPIPLLGRPTFFRPPQNWQRSFPGLEL